MDKHTVALALTAFDAVLDVKGRDVVGMDLEGLESYTDFILIVSGGSERQVASLADSVIKKVFKKHKLHPLGTEGLDACEWVLVDFGELVVHVFLDTVREHYHLEDMWMNVKPIAQDDFVTTVKSLSVKKTPAKKAAPARRRRTKS